MSCVSPDLCNRKEGCWPWRAGTKWWDRPGWRRWAWPRYLGWRPASWTRWWRPPWPGLTEQRTNNKVDLECWGSFLPTNWNRMYVWPRDSAAMKAVVTLLAHSTAAWVMSTVPLVKTPRMTAAMAARKPTTVAWTWERQHNYCSVSEQHLSSWRTFPESIFLETKILEESSIHNLLLLRE